MIDVWISIRLAYDYDFFTKLFNTANTWLNFFKKSDFFIQCGLFPDSKPALKNKNKKLPRLGD